MTPRTWYKGAFAGFAPIWVSDPLGQCFVHPRGILGHILLPVAEIMVQLMNMVLFSTDPTFEPHFPIGYDDRKGYQPDGLNKLFDRSDQRGQS